MLAPAPHDELCRPILAAFVTYFRCVCFTLHGSARKKQSETHGLQEKTREVPNFLLGKPEKSPTFRSVATIPPHFESEKPAHRARRTGSTGRIAPRWAAASAAAPGSRCGSMPCRLGLEGAWTEWFTELFSLFGWRLDSVSECKPLIQRVLFGDLRAQRDGCGA